MERHVEVGVFSDRIMFQSVSIPLQNGLCFLHAPNPCTPMGVPYGFTFLIRRRSRGEIQGFHVPHE
jgi:hypothetical protein